MIITIELTLEEEARLKAEATRRNLEPTALVHSLISTLQKPMSGAEAIAFWEEQDCLDFFADHTEDSIELARKLREGAEKRDWNTQ